MDSHSASRHISRHKAVAYVVAAALFALVAAPAGAATFSNTTPITIPATRASGQGGPYPSMIAVSGLTGVITNVDVTLTGASHTFPADVDVLLVGPFGQNVVLLSDAGAGTDINNITLHRRDRRPVRRRRGHRSQPQLRHADHRHRPPGSQRRADHRANG